MKKLLVLVLFLVAILLVSCNTETPSESDAHVHDFSGELKYDENGHYTTCECGEVSRSEHVEGESREIKKATCISEGSKYFVCKECGYHGTVTLPKTEHEHEKLEAVPATCTQKGVSAYEHCDICKIDIGKETSPMLEHDYKDGVCTMCGSSDPDSGDIDVSGTEEIEYEVVYHTEYVPEHLGVNDAMDEYYYLDHWHVGACFDEPPASFFEYFSDRITNESYALFRNAYRTTYTYDIYFGFWLEYFKITKDEYIAYLDYAVDMDDPKAVYEFDTRYPLVRYVNGWYGENYMEDPYLVAKDTEYVSKHYYAKKRDGKHNSLYYMINEDLINYVGQKKFKEYLKKYENTNDCNILSFIEYFDIDYLEFNKAISGPAPDMYLARFIYGSKREQEAFFGFYDNDSVDLLSAFNPFVMPSRDLSFLSISPFYDPRIFEISQEFMIYFLGYENKIPVERPAELHEFERLFGGTYQYNYSFFIKYYGITEKEWKEFINEMYYQNAEYDNPRYIGDIEFDFDLLFREDYFLDSVKTAYPFSSELRECKYETYYGEIIDEKYNQVYYTIDRLLIEHVGKKAFQKFLDKYEGTADCNIIKFLEFNDLSLNDVKYVYRNSNYGGYIYWGNVMPYNFSILYMDPKSEDFQKYFGYGVLN